MKDGSDGSVNGTKMAKTKEKAPMTPMMKQFFSFKAQCPEAVLLFRCGARHYDPFVARWLSPDPLMEKYYGMSPYLYCAGNPVNLVDPDGEDWYRIRGDAGEWEYTYDEDIYDDDSMTAMGITGEYLGATYHDYKANMYMENLSPLVIMAISKMNRLIVLRELFSPL